MNIFISHKHEDAETALLLKRRLESFGGGKVDCFVSEHVPYGADWFENIRENLRRADALVLIFTSSDMTWDWPLYEVGLATDLTDPESCSIITLYPPGSEPPEPIRHVQAVEASEEGLRDLVIGLFCTCDILKGDEPVNERLRNDPDSVTHFARELSARFTAANPWENCFTYFFQIVVPDGSIEAQEVPADAHIDPCSTALALFQLADRPPRREFWSWDDLVRTVEEHRGSLGSGGEVVGRGHWIDDLGERFYYASRGENLKDTRSTFRSLEGGELFRPLLHRVKLRTDGSMLFEVICVRHYEGEA